MCCGWLKNKINTKHIFRATIILPLNRL